MLLGDERAAAVKAAKAVGDCGEWSYTPKATGASEVLSFGASQATTLEVTLTTSWTQYSISLLGVNYNTDAQGGPAWLLLAG